MANKKKDEKSVEEQTAEVTGEASATEENAGAVEAQGAEANDETAENTQATEEQPEKSKQAKSEDAGDTSIVDAVIGTVANAVESVAGAVTSLVGGSDTTDKAAAARGNRAERVGTVTSDKMTKTVVVRVDRLVKHPKYRKYVRQKKQFMAHDELGATIGDKVRIIETRPLSARKRWRVVEIVQKAAK
jgi:small subunit ribosomal protein S17